jgi:signal transduction histidine kinase
VQEAINNAVKHASPSEIKVSIKKSQNRLLVSVTDDGSGLAENYDQNFGMGIYLMSQRASIIGGILNVNRRKPRGTILTCFINYNPQIEILNSEKSIC